MKVNKETQNADYLKKLNNTQKHLVIKKEEELKSLQSLYKEKSKQAKILGEENVFNQHEMNKINVAKSIQTKEDHLDRIKQDMLASANKLSEQKKTLTESLQEQIENKNAVFEEKIKHIHNSNMAASKDLTDRTKTEFKDLQHKSDQQVKNLNQDVKNRANSVSRDNRKSMRQLELNQKAREEQLKSIQEEQMGSLERDHNAKVSTEKKKHLIDYNQRVRSQQVELTNVELHHQEILKQKRTSFKEKFNLLEKNHTEILDRIKTKFDTEIKDIVGKYSEFKNQTMTKLQDKFYNISKLKPTVENKLDHYIVKLTVPDHEKELVNLTAQDRDINLTLTRKFSEKMQDQSGDKFNTRRSEVMNKTFNVDKIMDSTSVERKYEDGVLSFKIAKR